jgi:hypothetical protein
MSAARHGQRRYVHAVRVEDDWVELSGSTSVIAALQDENNWQNVTVDYAQVVNVSEVQSVSVDTAEYLAVRLDVEVVW